MSIRAHVTSVTYSYSPSLQRCAETFRSPSSDFQTLGTADEPLFLAQGDYWMIRYHGHTALLKASRGLHCLAFLLRHPGLEFHVSQLCGPLTPHLIARHSNGHRVDTWQNGALSDGDRILDLQAKSDYKHRLDDLRKDLDEAERFNDPVRAERARNEIAAITEHLAAVVGFGGRSRRMGSDVERARCAVTKRIKASMHRIGEAIPSLGRHLAAQIKTGYYCSYNLSREHPVAWKCLVLLSPFFCDMQSYDVI